jgi:hypothetical protein
MDTKRTTQFNIKNHPFSHALCIYASCMIRTNSAIIALNSTNQLDFVVGTQCVFCEACTHSPFIERSASDTLMTLLAFVLLHKL